MESERFSKEELYTINVMYYDNELSRCSPSKKKGYKKTRKEWYKKLEKESARIQDNLKVYNIFFCGELSDTTLWELFGILKDNRVYSVALAKHFDISIYRLRAITEDITLINNKVSKQILEQVKGLYNE